MSEITKLAISYPDFKLQEIIDPDQFDMNNKDIVDKINEILARTNINTTNISTINTASFPLKADKTYVDTQDSALQKQITDNRTLADTRHTSVTTRLTTNETAITNLNTTKATYQYVDDKIALIQSGYIADNSVTTIKLVDGSITTSKLENLSVTSSKVDGVTVYTATQVNSRIASDVATAKIDLQNQITSNDGDIKNINDNVTYTNNRIDNLTYNKDLYSAKQDIIVLAINLEVLRDADLTGINENMILETLVNLNDINVQLGLYNADNRKVYLP